MFEIDLKLLLELLVKVAFLLGVDFDIQFPIDGKRVPG
jgi:hypothetical protein